MVVILSSYCITDSVRQEFRWRPITSRVRLGSVRLSRAHRGLRSLARLPKVLRGEREPYRLCLLQYPIDGKTTVTKLPQPSANQKQILTALCVTVPAS